LRDEVKVHWIVKAASVYLWIMFLVFFITFHYSPDYRYFTAKYIPFFLDFVSLLIPQVFLTWIAWKSIGNKGLLHLIKLSPLLPVIDMAINPYFVFRIFYYYIAGVSLISFFNLPVPTVMLFIIVSIISIVVLIMNAWHPIISKRR